MAPSAPGMATRAATSAALISDRRPSSPQALRVAISARIRVSCAGLVATISSSVRWMSASMPCASATAITSSTLPCIAATMARTPSGP